MVVGRIPGSIEALAHYIIVILHCLKKIAILVQWHVFFFFKLNYG